MWRFFFVEVQMFSGRTHYKSTAVIMRCVTSDISLILRIDRWDKCYQCLASTSLSVETANARLCSARVRRSGSSSTHQALIPVAAGVCDSFFVSKEVNTTYQLKLDENEINKNTTFHWLPWYFDQGAQQDGTLSGRKRPLAFVHEWDSGPVNH